MAPMRMLCASVLRSVVLTSKNVTEAKKQSPESDDEVSMDVDGADESDDEKPRRRRRREAPPADDEEIMTPDLSDVMDESLNWTSILV